MNASMCQRIAKAITDSTEEFIDVAEMGDLLYALGFVSGAVGFSAMKEEFAEALDAIMRGIAAGSAASAERHGLPPPLVTEVNVEAKSARRDGVVH